jgi:ATP-dependent Lon protease
MSLGGVRDEAEIRGHRRTYIGALPGQVIQMMKKAGTRNPVFLLDEVDKMSTDFRGDPSAALLEVLDPEQNSAFQDHYLDVEYDLSQILFIATANVLHTIPAPLQDRMEVIRLSGYTELEKMEIAKRFLVRKQMEANGLKADDIEFTDGGLKSLILHYTREAGVRNLEREVGNVARKVARKVVLLRGPVITDEEEEPKAKKRSRKQKAEDEPVVEVAAEPVVETAIAADAAAEKALFEKVTVTPLTLPELLGPFKFRELVQEKKNEVGAATGLAWTEVGGSILQTEVTTMDGRGKLTITGKLGDVMQESAQAAMSYVRSRSHALGLSKDFYRNVDLHIHVPEGAIPKDGPSAGITLATAITSALTRIPVRADVAMTGEVTLRGKVLPIGGLKEKLLAAHRQGINEAILPKDNEKDLPEVPENIRAGMKLHLVDSMDEVLKIALEREVEPLPVMPTVAAELPILPDQTMH